MTCFGSFRAYLALLQVLAPGRLESALAVLLCVCLGIWLRSGLTQLPPVGQSTMGPAEHYLANAPLETGTTNVVSAILYDYRGFDTLGESTIIFTAVTGVALLFSGFRLGSSAHGLSVLVKRGVGVLAPFMIVFGAYVVLFGHISPGGGFQGGVVFATVAILLCIVYGAGFDASRVSIKTKSVVEAIGALSFVGIGVAGLLAGGAFLTNLAAGFSAGSPGTLVSGGFVPLLNAAVGMKVGAGLAMVFFSMVREVVREVTGGMAEEVES